MRPRYWRKALRDEADRLYSQAAALRQASLLVHDLEDRQQIEARRRDLCAQARRCDLLADAR